MTIQYTLVDTKRFLTFALGTHRMVYADELRRFLEDPTGEPFVDACVREIRVQVSRFPDAFVNPNLDDWATSTRTRAEGILAFVTEAGLSNVRICHDAGDDMLGWEGLPEVGSVYGL